MESVFLRFDSYKFEADNRFVDGLKTLKKSESSTDELVDMKLFFYNRFVEPIDRTSYKQWSSSFPRGAASGCHAEQLDQRTSSQSHSDICENPTADTSAHTEVRQLSFAEVMQLVQEGKEVPGITKLDIQPSNQSPTPSQMERRLKPWETTSK